MYKCNIIDSKLIVEMDACMMMTNYIFVVYISKSTWYTLV